MRETACVCTRKHLVLASHKLLCQTCFAKRPRERPANGKERQWTWDSIALLVAFLAVVILIIRGQSPIIMLLILAVLWAAIAGIGIDDIQKKVIQAGGVQYASAVIIIVFGAWFAQILIQTGIAESVIRSAVELAGDRPLATAMTITLVTALLFTSMLRCRRSDRDRRHRAADHDEPGHSTTSRGARFHDGDRRRHVHQPRSVRYISKNCFPASNTRRRI